MTKPQRVYGPKSLLRDCYVKNGWWHTTWDCYLGKLGSSESVWEQKRKRAINVASSYISSWYSERASEGEALMTALKSFGDEE